METIIRRDRTDLEVIIGWDRYLFFQMILGK